MAKEVTVIMKENEIYPSLIQMIIQAENITWNRFNNFLMFNTILVLAWSTIYAADHNANQSFKWPLVTFCIFGGLSGIFWALLGIRGRKYLNKYLEVAREFENDKTAWGNECRDDKFRLANTTLKLSVRSAASNRPTVIFPSLCCSVLLFI
jgi:hypothetical protein